MQDDNFINVDTINTATAAVGQTNELDADAEEKVRVFVRLRPVETNASSNKESENVPALGAKSNEDGMSIEVFSPRDGSFTTHFFDGVFDEISHEDLYQQTASNLISAIRDGQNACLIAYGQTGTGKTYTMFGDSETHSFSEHRGLEKEGIVQCLTRELMADISSNNEGADEEEEEDNFLKQFPPVVMCSYIELYQDEFKDLLATSDDAGIAAAGKFKVSSPSESKGRVGTGAVGGLFMAGAYWESCNDVGDVMITLNKGNLERSTSATNMNSASSRSHAIFTIKVLYPGCAPRYLHLVDLAGSELASKTNALGETMQEAKAINKSLFALGNVVRAVTQGRSHIPYRDSKLTHFLQDAIGGSAVTSIILTVSPMASDASETMSTIRFGHRAKKVTNKKQLDGHDKKEHLQYSAVTEGHFCDETLAKRKHDGDDGIDDLDNQIQAADVDGLSISSLEMAAETTIVPSEPSINQDSSIIDSPSLSSETSLHASMVNSSCIHSDLASISFKSNVEATLVQPEHPKSGLVPSERFSFNSPLTNRSTKNAAHDPKESNMQVSNEPHIPESGGLDDVYSTPYSSLDDADNAKLSHSSDSYFNVGRNLVDSGNDYKSSTPIKKHQGSQSPRSVAEVQSNVSKNTRSRSFYRAVALIGILVFCISSINIFKKDDQSGVWSELDFCPANVSLLDLHGYGHRENITNVNVSIVDSLVLDGGTSNHTYDAPTMEGAQSHTGKFAAATLATVLITICLSKLLDGYGRKRNSVNQNHSHGDSDTGVLHSLSKPILKDILREKNLKVSGTKKVLINRLLDSVNSDACKTPTPVRRSKKNNGEDLSRLTVSMLKTKLKEKGLKVTGTKTDLLVRLKLADDIDDLTKSELKEMLSKKGLKVSGTKADLADRLVQAKF